MAIIRTEDVVAIWVGGELVCADCATPEEWDGASAEELVCEGDLDREREIYCCGRTGRQI